MTLVKRFWRALRGGAAYEQLEQKGQWATWQLPDGDEPQGTQPDVTARPLDEGRD
jgi:hypothetical protein